jgi:hypothetical protein
MKPVYKRIMIEPYCGVMHELLGKTIEEIYINEYRDQILFKSNSANWIYRVEGDCCTYATFESIIYPPKRYAADSGKKESWLIRNIKQIENGDADPADDSSLVYAVEFTTLMGTLFIEWRNHIGNWAYQATCDLILYCNNDPGYTYIDMEKFQPFLETTIKKGKK